MAGMSDLVEFYTARLDEDEEIAQGCDGPHYCTCAHVNWVMIAGDCDCAYPARALRDVEAKRRRLARHIPTDDPLHGRLCSRCSVVQVSVFQKWPCPDVLDDAAIYSDHEDYLEEWRV